MPPLVFCRKTRPAPPVAIDYRLRCNEHELAGSDLDHDHALAASILYNEVDTKIFVEPLNRRIFDRRLKQRVEDVKSGFVGSIPSTLNLHAAKCPHVDMAIRLAAPGAAPVLELHHLFGAMRNKIIDDILIT